MIYQEALNIVQEKLLPSIVSLYELKEFSIKPIEAHYGGRNIVCVCEKENLESKILRISFTEDRKREDYLAELEFVSYLSTHGASVANVISSSKGNLLEEMVYDGHIFYLALFEKAKGDLIAEHQYAYIEGRPIEEYFFNCGKTLGKMHELSKSYTPTYKRYDYFDKFNMNYINSLLPDSLDDVRLRMSKILERLEKMGQDKASYGMIHFDYNDGNYNIDYKNGDITVFDFDNCCFGWYMYDLAGLWVHGTGWIQFEEDALRRKAYMEKYFETVLKGYLSETQISKEMLDELPFFIDVYLMENIVDEFEVLRNEDEAFDPEDEELQYTFRCFVEEIPYRGFFDKIYSCNAPFQLVE